MWIPPFQAKGSHSALMADGSTDRYFKFDFYVPGQASPHLRQVPEGEEAGHLTLYLILDWSYSRQSLIDEFDERRSDSNIGEQEELGRKVISFYRGSRLPYPVWVHRELAQTGRKPIRELKIGLIELYQ